MSQLWGGIYPNVTKLCKSRPSAIRVGRAILPAAAFQAAGSGDRLAPDAG